MIEYENLVADRYFEIYPEKVLGQSVETTDRFGKNVTEVRGTLNEALKKFPDDLPKPVKYDMRPAAQHSKNPDYKESNIRKAIKQTEQSQAAPTTEGLDMLDMDEVLKKFHPDITKDDLQLWVNFQRGKLMSETTILNQKNGWSKYVIPKADMPEKHKKWIADGKICFDGNEWIPYYIYYSGNIYQKWNDLQDREDRVIETIGKEAYNRQLRRLEKAKPTVLKIQSPEGNDLHISPLDKIAEEFTILETTDGNVFEKPVSLLGAFFYYLDTLDRDDFKHGSNAMDIERHWIHRKSIRNEDDLVKAQRMRHAQQDGMYLFEKFLRESLTRVDQQILEHTWNSRYNAFQEPNYNKIPVGLEVNRWFKNTEIAPRPALWEGVKFLTANGSGIVAFDVGVGKTMTSILAMAQALYTGQCKRPLVVVPNPTYDKWIAETVGEYDDEGNIISHGILPQFKDRINDYYNLGDPKTSISYLERARNNPPKDNTITFVTFQGLMNMGMSQGALSPIKNELFSILNQGLDRREAAQLDEKVDTMMGTVTAKTSVNFDELGFDYLIVDEAHNFKKVFTKVKGETEGEGSDRDAKQYEMDSGLPSARGLKLFVMSQFILRNNNMRNMVMLTATPFTNSPLEIYSMLSLVAYQELERRGINNIKHFFDKFINETYELAVTPKGKIEHQAVVKSFNNRIVLQNIIFNYIIHKTGEEANVPRPKKVVYPLFTGEKGITLPYDEQVDTALPPTPDQEYWMKEISRFANEETDNAIEPHVPQSYYKDGKLLGRVLMAINLQQSLTLSPYLFRIGENKIIYKEEPTHREYVETSPKLYYVTESIRTIRQWHEKRNEPISGVVIYMNRGTHYFDLVKKYLIDELGYEAKEIAIIKGGIKQEDKERIKKHFLEGKTKVIIGSASIKEGIDLQNKATTLFNCNLDWNPTDIQQVEGRIWRQGNQHSHVRIVIPMIENSVDVLMFQKLDEKTSRINDIWYRAGKGNVLDVDNLDPEDLKMALMTDPYEAAKSQINQELQKVKMEQAVMESTVEELNEATRAIGEFSESDKELREVFPEAESTLNKELGAIKIELQDEDELTKTKKEQLEGRKRSLEKVLEKDNEDKRYYRILRSYVQHLLRTSGVWNYRAFRLKDTVERQLNRVKRMEKIQKKVLDRFNLTIMDDLQPVIKEYEEKAANLAEQVSELESEETLNKKVAEIRAERRKQQKYSKPVPERVKSFTKHNHLLSCMRDIHDCKLCPKEVIPAKGKAQMKGTKTEKPAENTDVKKVRADIEQLKTLIEMVSDASDKKKVKTDIEQLKDLIDILKAA